MKRAIPILLLAIGALALAPLGAGQVADPDDRADEAASDGAGNDAVENVQENQSDPWWTSWYLAVPFVFALLVGLLLWHFRRDRRGGSHG